MRDELQLLQEPAGHIGEVVKQMGKNKVLVKINPDGKYIVDIDKDIDINACTPGVRVALRNDSYTLHRILPTKVDPLVSLMKVEKVPDASYDMVGGLDQQIQVSTTPASVTVIFPFCSSKWCSRKSIDPLY